MGREDRKKVEKKNIDRRENRFADQKYTYNGKRDQK